MTDLLTGYFVIWYQLLRYLALKLIGSQERRVGDIFYAR